MDVPELTQESIDRLTKLLDNWRLRFLLPQFIEEKIDEEVLEMIDASHINLLLHKYPMGVQIRFAHHLNNWRKNIGKPLNTFTFKEILPNIRPMEAYECYNERENSLISKERTKDVKDSLVANDNGNIAADKFSKRNSSIHPIAIETETVKSLSMICKPKIDLEELLLKSPPNGPDLIQIYGKQKHFTHLDRKRLVSTVVNYYLECKLPLDLATSYDLEDAIIKMFPSETLKMYRNGKQGKIFNRYNQEKLKEKEIGEQIRDESMNDNFEGVLNDGSITHLHHDVLIQTIFEDEKKFTKIRSPFLYCSFLTTACEMFNIAKISDYCIFINGYEVEEDRFNNFILKFYKSPTFAVELKPKSKTLDPVVISKYLPDVEYMRNIPRLRPLLKINENGNLLKNMHRTAVAKTIIDECLKLNPERILKRPDFIILADTICKTFRNEITSTYFIPCSDGKPARGKLWSAYINKRSLLCSTGLVARRRCTKRKLSSNSEFNCETDNNAVKKLISEYPEFSSNVCNDWKTLLKSWSETYDHRRWKLEQGELSSEEYMLTYPILQSNNGFHFVEQDLKRMHPVMGTVDNWLIFYDKVVDKVRNVRKYEHVPRIIEQIDDSMDTRYRASLALNLLVYIFTSFPRCSKPEIQNRFLKEYKNLKELENDGKPAELQIRFVHQYQQIVYADFALPGGFIFKYNDLLEALSHCFYYIMALNLNYPKICLCLWQFIQVAIFQIDIKSGKLPQIESSINDLLHVNSMH
ncbi:uncharacterized protein LOC142237995 [Haematobia irritans]|uniref:uncharacterized protein LOC142237995 n=1 Tax=Haematobia irritans TaxID=7368 RepID=UPI003F4FDB14